VNPEEMGRVRITHETCPRLFHVTYKSNITSLVDKGLRPGGLDPDGRKEIFFSCKSQFEGRHATAYSSNVNNLYQKILEREAERKYKAACAAMISNPTGQPVLEGYPFKKGDPTLCIDTKKAEEHGIDFWQTAALAIVTNKPIPPTCFIHVEDLKTGAIILSSPKTVRPSTHHEASECKRAKPAVISAENWLDSHHVQASSSSAGGNLTATNATASDNGIITVDLEAEVTRQKLHQVLNQLRHKTRQIPIKMAKMLTVRRNLSQGEDSS
jgi:hypothetical protein